MELTYEMKAWLEEMIYERYDHLRHYPEESIFGLDEYANEDEHEVLARFEKLLKEAK